MPKSVPVMIAHRINGIDQLSQLSDRAWGCEVDLRSDLNKPGSLHLSHDPWIRGPDFEDWLDDFTRLNFLGPLIVNTKEDGLEEQAIKILRDRGVDNYFFLDTALPTLIKRSKPGFRNFALRLSTYEQVDSAITLKGKVGWAWIDCFEANPIPMIQNLKERLGVQICLVSPELQGGNQTDFNKFIGWAEICDAICTKLPTEWRKTLDSKSPEF